MDRETVITHLQIIHTWASFARERDLQFFTEKHLEDIAQWADDALNMLNEYEERKGNYVPCKVKTPTGKWNGEKCSVCGTEYIGSAPLQWKFCPDCGAKMEGR